MLAFPNLKLARIFRLSEPTWNAWLKYTCGPNYTGHLSIFCPFSWNARNEVGGGSHLYCAETIFGKLLILGLSIL